MTRVAVSGADGFIGRHVVDRLSAEPGVEVFRVSLPDGPAFLNDGGDGEAVSFNVLDARDGFTTLDGAVDVLLHLAWSGLNDFRSEVHQRQVAAHEHFIRAWLERGVSRVVGVGTCLEYGLREGELTEDMTAQPVIAYAEAKAELSERLEQLAGRFGATWAWSRIFYPYGDGQHPRSLWTSLHVAIDRGDALFPMSGGEQVRDYLPVSEAGAALSSLALADWAVGHVNICSGKPVKVKDLVADWIEARGSTIRPDFGIFSYSDYEPMSFWGSRSRLERLLSGVS